MNLNDFNHHVGAISTPRDEATAAMVRIPAGCRDDWYTFSSFTRAQYGAQGIRVVTDDAHEQTLTPGVRVLAGPVPVDYLFPETRQACKDDYQDRCSEVGDPEKADEQTAEWHMAHAPLDQSRIAQRAEFLRLGSLLGEPVVEVPDEFFATLTRTEFDSAAVAVETASAAIRAFHAAIDSETVEAWMSDKDRIRRQCNVAPHTHVKTRDIDAEFFSEETLNAAAAFVSSVPLGPLVDETRDAFLTRYTEECERLAREQAEKDAAQEALNRATQARHDRAEYIALGQRLGVMDTNGNATV